MKPFRKLIKTPTLWIAPIVNEKVKALIQTCPKEVGWHGLVERIDDSTFVWYDVLLYPQYVTGASVNPDADEYAKWMNAQYDYDNGKSFKNLRLHGHSHVNMAVSPSGIDLQFREDILTNLQDNDFYIFTIWNKKGDMEWKLFDTTTDFIFDESELLIKIGTPEQSKKILDWVTKVIKNNVKEYKYSCSTTSKAKNY